MNANPLGVGGTCLIVTWVIEGIVMFSKINLTFTHSGAALLKKGRQRTNI